MVRAHRFAFVHIGKQALPTGYEILHTCDNTKCVNPEHLTAGTHKDNMADMAAKGRARPRVRPLRTLPAVQRGTYKKRTKVNDKDRARITRKVSKDEATGCWNWTGALSAAGYGASSMFGKICYAHRAAYLCFKGPIPDGMIVRHTCDNKICCNPQHLILGSHHENMQDASLRGRFNSPARKAASERGRGVGNGRSVLTEETVRQIISLLATYTNPQIAELHGTSKENVRQIRIGRSWKWLARPLLIG